MLSELKRDVALLKDGYMSIKETVEKIHDKVSFTAEMLSTIGEPETKPRPEMTPR